MSQEGSPEGAARQDQEHEHEQEQAARRSIALEKARRVDAWHSVKQSFAFALAADDHATHWLERFTKVADRIQELSGEDPDVALYMMLQTATNDTDNYSASHAMFCAVVADLCAAYFGWSQAEATAVRNAALTMNLGMLLMQNSMAQQTEAPSPAQKQRVEDHPARSVELLRSAGVDDPLWLETVRRHHRPVDDGESSDPLAPAQRLAQLLQRIDVFTAKLSRRKTRPGSTATVAARDACLDPSGRPDATGATLLRVLGLYPPGSFVHLATGETGVVIRRGDRAHTPLVACVRRADGGVIGQPMLRDTGIPANAVQRSLAADEVKIRLDHERTVGARG